MSRKMEPFTALTITPTKSSVIGSSRPRCIAREKTTVIASSPPVKAKAC